MEKKLNNEVIDRGNKELFMATFLLKLSGGDRIPTEVKDHVIKDLGLSAPDSLLAFTNHKLDEEEDDEKKLNFIKGLMVAQLRPSQFMSLHSFVRDVVTSSLESMAEHPEQREDVSVETLMKDMHKMHDIL